MTASLSTGLAITCQIFPLRFPSELTLFVGLSSSQGTRHLLMWTSVLHQCGQPNNPSPLQPNTAGPRYSPRPLPELLRGNPDFFQFLESSARSMFVGDRHRRTIERFLKPIKVTLLHQQGQRVRPILGVEWKTPSQVMFVLRNQDQEMLGATPERRNEEISVQVNKYYTTAIARAH